LLGYLRLVKNQVILNIGQKRVFVNGRLRLNFYGKRKVINKMEIELNENFKEFIELLNAKKVKYLVVGGFAVGLYGYPRYTGDFDVWVQPDLENGKKVISVLKEFGFGSLKVSEKDFLSDDLILQFGYPPLRIDVLTGISGVVFSQCYLRRKRTKLGGSWISLIHLTDLMINKKNTGRPEDLFDVKKLEQIKLNGKKNTKKKR